MAETPLSPESVAAETASGEAPFNASGEAGPAAVHGADNAETGTGGEASEAAAENATENSAEISVENSAADFAPESMADSAPWIAATESTAADASFADPLSTANDNRALSAAADSVAPQGSAVQPATPAETAMEPAATTAAPAPAPSDVPAPSAEATPPTSAMEPEPTPAVEPAGIATTIAVPPLETATRAEGDGGEWELLVAKLNAWFSSGELGNQWQKLRGPLKGVAILFGVILVLRLYATVVGTIDGIPLVSGLLELTGLIVLGHFSLTKMVRTSEREQVLATWKRRWQAFIGQD